MALTKKQKEISKKKLYEKELFAEKTADFLSQGRIGSSRMYRWRKKQEQIHKKNLSIIREELQKKHPEWSDTELDKETLKEYRARVLSEGKYITTWQELKASYPRRRGKYV